jgi:hypothetical protein
MGLKRPFFVLSDKFWQFFLETREDPFLEYIDFIEKIYIPHLARLLQY